MPLLLKVDTQINVDLKKGAEFIATAFHLDLVGTATECNTHGGIQVS